MILKRWRLILCFLLMLSVLTACGNAAVPQEYVDYLAQNAIPLSELGAQDAGYTRFSEYQVILIGESHGTQKTFEAELMLLEHLNQAYGVRHILLELGYCDGELLNDYLQNGDEAILQEMLENLKGTSAYSEETYTFYQSLYEYNRNLPEGETLYLSGVDVQHQLKTGAYYLYRLLPDTPPPEQIASHIAALSAYTAYTEEALAALRQSIVEQEATYLSYLGEEAYGKFLRGVESMRQGVDYYASDDDGFREACMISNCIEALEAHPAEMAYGIFGDFHTTLSGACQDGQPVLANYLNNSYEKTAGLIASITCLYDKSKSRRPNGVFDINSGYAITVKAAPLMPDDIAFCPLDLSGSPFGAEGERSLESQQYLVIIRNSAAVNPYGGE